MNMISTGSFLTETSASTKQSELVKTLTSAWEKKNSKAARAGGVSLMALSLAACGSSDDDTPFSQADIDAAVAAVDLTSDNQAAVDAALAAAVDATPFSQADLDAAVAAVDITSDNAAIAATARAEGVASVDITSDNQAAIDAALVAATPLALTAGMDDIKPLAGDQNYVANVAVNPADGVASVETLTAIDIVDGGDGNDSLTYITVGGAALPSATIKNIETINVKSDGAVTANVNNITGVTTLTANAIGADVNIDGKTLTTVHVTGTAQSIDITDNATTKVLTTVSIDGYTDDGANAADDMKIDSTALTSLTLSNSTMVDDGDDLISDASGSITINLENVAGGAADVLVSDATAAVINTTGATKTVVVDDLDVDAATTVSINANAKTTTIDGLDIESATILDINGSGNLVLTAGTYTALTTFDATDATGNVTLTQAIDNADTYKGGSGKDTIASMGATTKDHTLGAGNDSVTLTVSALGTSGTIDAGDGIDTLGMTAANAATASSAATFEATISNFEKLSIAEVATNTDTTINLANLDEINYVVSQGIAASTAGGTDTTTFTNFQSGGTLELQDDNGTSTAMVVSVSGAAIATADVFNLAINTGTSSGIVAANSITIADVETINISTQDGQSATTDVAATIQTATLVATSATTVTVTGNNGLTLTNTGNVKIATFDASGVVADKATDTAANLAVSFTSDNVTTAVSITGGAGNDSLIADSASTKVNTINGGAGNDTVTGGAGADVLIGGAGADTITGNGGADTMTGGAGNDNFVIGVVASKAIYDTITDATAGDTITLAANLGNAFTTTAVSVAGGSFSDHLDAAAGAADTAAWFQYGGNTYLVGSANAVNGFTNGTDTVVELTGLLNLANSTIADDVLTLVDII